MKMAHTSRTRIIAVAPYDGRDILANKRQLFFPVLPVIQYAEAHLTASTDGQARIARNTWTSS